MTTATKVRIAYDRVGDGGPALLMLPGWCTDRAGFHDLLALTGRHRTCVALDWRGHGGSARNVADFGSADLLDDALTVVEAAGLERVVPVAQSHAGWVAIELQRRLGIERVPGIVSLDWMVLGPPPPFMGALAGLQDPAQWEQVRGALFQMWTTGVASTAVHAFVDRMGQYSFEMWSRAGREIAADFARQPSPVAALAEDPAPFLHVYAQPTDDAYLAAQQDFGTRHPWFDVQRVSGRSHFSNIETPTETAAAIESFVNGL
jgi:pimeloyl-ACP methyl ester carboxylesterase